MFGFIVACSGTGACAESADFEGLTLEQAIQKLEDTGLAIVYSSDLVAPDLRVIGQPKATDPRAILAEIVSPYGLKIDEGPSGQLMIVRRPMPAPIATEAAGVAPPLTEVIVSASRYRFSLSDQASSAELTAGDLEVLPKIGEDPIRAVASLPGVARQDFTGKPNMRGGVSDETLVRFDMLRLYDPYHLKDFQSIFSTIDPNVVDRLIVYTAGFPASYGDRMSGVIDIAPVRPGKEFGGRLSASLFNLMGLVGGPLNDDKGDWLVSARRGNLDLALNLVETDLGRPAYSDLYARLSHRVGDRSRLSGSLLLSDDDLEVNDSDGEAEATAEYRDKYYWLGLDIDGFERAGGRLLLAHTELSSQRSGRTDRPGVSRGILSDKRNFAIDSLTAEGWWSPRPDSLLQAGFEWRTARGDYDYSDQVEFDVLFLTEGAPQSPARIRQLSVRPDGNHYAAFASWRYDVADSLTTDIGLRWDRESLSPHGSDRLSPRLGLLWRLDDATRLRASWGSFFQAQGIDELQVSDGDPQIYSGQLAEHLIVSAEHDLGDGFDLRLEAYTKHYSNLRPRYENMLDTLVVLPELEPDRIRIDPQSGRADGAEIMLRYEEEPFGGWLGYSWASVKDRMDGEDIPRSWDQAHFIGAGGSYDGPNWQMSLAMTWHSGWPTTAVELASLEPYPLVATGSRNAVRLGNYLRFDARIARRWELASSQQITVFIEASNLTNRSNDCCVEYQLESEETAVPFLDTSVRRSIPIVPSIGIIWDF